MSFGPPAIPARPELLALLRDAKEAPADDRLRLVLADWLEDTGRPLELARAELIRTQLAPAGLGEQGHSTRNRKARRLVQRHGKDWLGRVAPWLVDYTAERGLWAVKVRMAHLRGRTMAELAGTEEWAWVDQVEPVGGTTADLFALGSHPLLQELTGLGLDVTGREEGWARAVAQLPWLARLTRLAIQGRPVRAAALQDLLSSQRQGALTSLSVVVGALGPPEMTVIATSACAARLERLVLWGNQLQPSALLALTTYGTMQGLAHLDLRQNWIGDEGAGLVSGSSWCDSLRYLDLADNRIGPAGARALAESAYLAKLECLVMWGNPIGPVGAQALRERFGNRAHLSELSG